MAKVAVAPIKIQVKRTAIEIPAIVLMTRVLPIRPFGPPVGRPDGPRETRRSTGLARETGGAMAIRVFNG
jgi:hypothetical protein